MEKRTQNFIAERDRILRCVLTDSQERGHSELLASIKDAATVPSPRLPPEKCWTIVVYVQTQKDLGDRGLLQCYVYVLWLAGLIQRDGLLEYADADYADDEHSLIDMLIRACRGAPRSLAQLHRLLSLFLRANVQFDEGILEVVIQLRRSSDEETRNAPWRLLSRFAQITPSWRWIICDNAEKPDATAQRLLALSPGSEPLSDDDLVQVIQRLLADPSSLPPRPTEITGELLQHIRGPTPGLENRILNGTLTSNDKLFLFKEIVSGGGGDNREVVNPSLDLVQRVKQLETWLKDREGADYIKGEPPTTKRRRDTSSTPGTEEDGPDAQNVRASVRASKRPKGAVRLHYNDLAPDVIQYVLDHHHEAMDGKKHNWGAMSALVNREFGYPVDKKELEGAYKKYKK
jgi:hypothetical protein